MTNPPAIPECGHRIETQTTRFLWDLVDTNNDSAMDDTDLSVSNIIAMMRGMSNAAGVDGSSNESHIVGCGTNDKYNVYDFSSALAGDETRERELSCVQNARD